MGDPLKTTIELSRDVRHIPTYTERARSSKVAGHSAMRERGYLGFELFAP